MVQNVLINFKTKLFEKLGLLVAQTDTHKHAQAPKHVWEAHALGVLWTYLVSASRLTGAPKIKMRAISYWSHFLMHNTSQNS